MKIIPLQSIIILMLGLLSCSPKFPYSFQPDVDNGTGSNNDDTDINLVVLTDQPNYLVKWHFGTNVHAIIESNSVKNGGLLGSSYGGIPVPEDTESWDKIFRHLDWFGFNWIRLGYEHNDIQPERGRYPWRDQSLSKEQTDNYNNILKYLDWAQSNNVDVLLQEMAQATDWNCIPGENIGHSAPADLEAWADGYVSFVKYLTQERGYSCITMLNISNEPDNPWGWWNGRRIEEGYHIVRQKLDEAGIDISLAGPEYMSDGSYTANWEECKPYIDIFESHNYDDSHNNMIAFRPIADPAYPTIWGEYAGGDNRDYDWNIKQAKWQVGGYNNGIDGFARWNFLNRNDIDGNFSYILTWDVEKKELIRGSFQKQPNLYHIDGLISRLVARNSHVLTSCCSEADLIPCAFRSQNGNYALDLVSQLPKTSSVSVTFQDLKENIVLYKYEITQDDKDVYDVELNTHKVFDLSPENPTFTDSVEPWSLVVYSTFQLSDDAKGIVEDGYVSSSEDMPPVESNPIIIDEKDGKLHFSEDFATKSDPGCYGGELKYSNAQGASVTFSFTGTGFRLYGQQDNGSGLAEVYVNGSFAGYASNYSPVSRNARMLYDSGTLPDGEYEVKIINSGTRSITSQGTYINIDAVAFPSADAIVND